ncbi:MAG: RES family NAD+ phosphorylase [Bauldia sp.]|nr:RES family NAD+ phosphorylase [Bauldia sp.]
MTLEAIKFRVVVEALLSMESEAFTGRVFRATALGTDPFEGSAEGRWSAGADVALLYTSLSAKSAVAELVDRLRQKDALAASRKQVLHEWDVSEARVVRLTAVARLKRLGLPDNFLDGEDYEPTQRIARAAFQIGTLQGMVVHSSIEDDANLVLFRDRLNSGQLSEIGTNRVRPVDLRLQRGASA